jgi:hypothetical protein
MLKGDRTMNDYRLLVTEGRWYDLIESGIKKFDFRKGYRDFNIGDYITFMEADSTRILTGRTCTCIVTLVIHSTDFPKHFNWDGGDFTIIQFDKEREQ